MTHRNIARDAIARDAIKEIKERNEKIRKRKLSIVLYQEQILEQKCILKQSENLVFLLLIQRN